MPSLACWESFVDALGPVHRESSQAAHARLGERLADARRAWPDIAYDERAFVVHVAARLPEGLSVTDGLSKLHIEDLALAFALGRSDPAALSAFERVMVPYLVSALGRTAADPAEIVQEIRVRLLVPSEGRAAKIDDYRGTGPLRSWLRVAALHAAVNRATRGTPDTPVEAAFFEALTTASDPASELDAKLHVESVKAAFRRAIATLSNREKGLLQYAFADGVSFERIGVVYGAHRSTVARWTELARERLKRAVEEDLRSSLGASASEVESLVRHVSHAIDSTIARQLKHRG